MKPGTKKILIYGGIGLGAYLLYTMVTKPAATPDPNAMPKLPASVTAPTATAGVEPRDHRTLTDRELGMSQDLGSLGGAFRR